MTGAKVTAGSELEQRLAIVEAADNRDGELRREDYALLALVCVAFPALLMVIGWVA
jgi:hypothetical protein